MKPIATITAATRDEHLQRMRSTQSNHDTLYSIYHQNRLTGSNSPTDTVSEAVKVLGQQAAAETIAELVNSVHEMDGRISRRTRTWAAAVENAATGNELHDNYRIFPHDKIHPAHIDAIASAAMHMGL